MLGRYFSPRDRRFARSITNELVKDIVQTFVMFYQISVEDTKENIYGEAKAATGKIYFSGVELAMLNEHPDPSSTEEGFGVDRIKKSVFTFAEHDLKKVEIYPQPGDIIYYDNSYYEIDNIVQEQFLAGQPNNSWSIACYTHLTKESNLNIVERQR